MKNSRFYFPISSPQKGFTLIEIIVVMVMIVLLASLVGPKLFPKLGQGKQKAAQAQIAMIEQALDHFRLDIGRYPTTEEGLSALVKDPGLPRWGGSYLKKGLPNDPWDRPYQYKCPGTHGDYDLFSYGRDGKPNGDGEDADVVNWK